MAKISPSAVFGFTILCFACVLNALEDNAGPNQDDSSKDLADFPYAYNNPSYGRIISPAVWSKEEKDNLKSSGDNNIGNEEQDKLFFEEESSQWNMKKLFRYFVSFLHTLNKNNGIFLGRSTGNEKFKTQRLMNNKPADRSENNVGTGNPNSYNDDALTKPEDNENVQSSGTDTLSKPKDEEKLQNSGSTNSSNDGKEKTSGTTDISNKSDDSEKVENPEHTDTLNKSPDSDNMQNLSNNASRDRIEPSRNLKTKEMEEQNPMTTTAQDSDGQIKSSTGDKIQNSAINSPLNESADNGDFSNTEKMRNGQQGTRNNNKPKEDSTKVTFKDYGVCNDDVLEEEANEYEVENDNEIDKYDSNGLDVNETEDGYEDETEDEIEDDYVNVNNSDNKNDTSPNGIENKNGNENNFDNDGNKLLKSGQNIQAVNVADEAASNTSVTLPKFPTQVIQSPQNYFEPQTSEKESNNTIDAPTPAVAESPNLTNQEKILQEFQLSNSEFLDTYINNPEGKTIDQKTEKSGNTQVFTPNRNNTKTEEMPEQTSMTENNYENNKSLNTTSPNNENMENQKTPYNQSENIVNNFTLENNGLPLTIFNSYKSDTNPNNVPLPESSPTTNEYNSKIINSLLMSPNRAIPIQNEGYLSDQYPNYNFQDVKKPGMFNEPDQIQKTALEQGIVSNILNQDSPNTSNTIMYSKNSESELPINSQNLKIPTTNTEMSSSDDLQSYLTINSINNENYSPVAIENGINNLDKITSQYQIDDLKLRNQINNVNNEEIINQQAESTNQPFQDKNAEPNQLSSQNDISKTSPQIYNGNNMDLEILPIQNDSNDTKFLQSQKVKNSNILPQNITEDGLENNNLDNKIIFFPVNIIREKSEGQEQEARDSNSNTGNSNDSSNLNSDNQNAKIADEEMTDLSDEKDPNEDEIEDDYVKEDNNEDGNNDEDETSDEDETNDEDKTNNEDENNYEDANEEEDKSENESEEGEEEEDENENQQENEGQVVKEDEEKRDGKKKNQEEEIDEDRVEDSYSYDSNKNAMNSQNPQVEIIDEKNHDNIATEDDKPQNKTNEENPMLMTQENQSRIENGANKQQDLQSGSSSPNQEGKFDTILEYIYKYSNNPLFKDIKEENNQPS